MVWTPGTACLRCQLNSKKKWLSVRPPPCAIEIESGKPAVACTDSRAEAMITSRKSPVDAYMAHNHGYNVPNFHRVVVHGETQPLEWLKLHIDPKANAPHGLDAFGPFSWKRVQPAL